MVDQVNVCREFQHQEYCTRVGINDTTSRCTLTGELFLWINDWLCMQIGKFHVLYLTPNDLLCTWTTFHRNEMKGSSELACSFTIPLTVDPTKLWILGDVIRNTATGIVFHKILSTKNFFLLENKWISSSCLGSYDEWSSNGIGIKDGFLLSICQLGTLMYANLYKYVPLLVLVSDRQMSLTISKCFYPAGHNILQSTTWWTWHPAKIWMVPKPGRWPLCCFFQSSY